MHRHTYKDTHASAHAYTQHTFVLQETRCVLVHDWLRNEHFSIPTHVHLCAVSVYIVTHMYICMNKNSMCLFIKINNYFSRLASNIAWEGAYVD